MSARCKMDSICKMLRTSISKIFTIESCSGVIILATFGGLILELWPRVRGS